MMHNANACTTFLTNTELIPLSFNYGGKEYFGLKQDFCEPTVSSRKYCNRTEYELCAVHLPSNATFRVYLTNWQERSAFSIRAEITAKQKTDVFSNISWKYSLQIPNACLCGNYGDDGSGMVAGYDPYCFKLSENDVHQQNKSGRPTHDVFPYYRVSADDGSGAFVVLSWQGRWFAHFSQNGDQVIFNGGQVGLESYLEAGETLRIPLMLVLDYQSDPINTWRRFYIDCLMPRPGGQLFPPTVAAFNGSCANVCQQMLKKVKGWYDKNDIEYDFWWCDAGWGADGTGNTNPSGLWLLGANFEVNREAFPDGMAWLGRELAQKNRQLMVWFEIEVVRTPDGQMDKFFEHYKDFKPEWILGRGGKQWNGLDLQWRLVNLGDPDMLAWLEDKIFTVMDEAGATIFRIDFNIDPAGFWDDNDTDGRKGMTENKYCQGYLKLIHDISKRYGALMDSCASGGGRNDLETVMYMYPLHYSDAIDNCSKDADGIVFMQSNFWKWMPYVHNFVSSGDLNDKYLVRSKYAQNLSLHNSQENIDSVCPDTLKNIISEWKKVSRYYYGDMYILLEASKNGSPAAFEFYCPDLKEGVVMLFMPNGGEVTLDVKGDFDNITCADSKDFTVKDNKLTVKAEQRESRIFFIKGN